MGFESQYRNAKERLLRDESICEPNRRLFAEFFDFQEYKLKRSNQLRELDVPCYKTLYGYTIKFRNVNAWFENKPWIELTKDDIKRVYDALEDGRILNRRGKPYEDVASYYNKVFKSKPFRLAGKSELARDVIEFSCYRPREVKFVTEQAFRDLVSVAGKPTHVLLLWLAWDTGENVGALLQLTKREFTRRVDGETHEAEYLVSFPRRILKRTRQSRGEPTLYPETVRFLDLVLADRADDEPVFGFGHRQALKIIHRAARVGRVKRSPDGKPPTWKDLRSGMACHLLRSGWSREEVDARLGHTPNSSALSAYINFMAIDRGRPKQKLSRGSHDAPGPTGRDALERENEDMRAVVAQARAEIAELQASVRSLLLRRDSPGRLAT